MILNVLTNGLLIVAKNVEFSWFFVYPELEVKFINEMCQMCIWHSLKQVLLVFIEILLLHYIDHELQAVVLKLLLSILDASKLHVGRVLIKVDVKYDLRNPKLNVFGPQKILEQNPKTPKPQNPFCLL